MIVLSGCSDMANRSTCGALCNGKRARSIARRRCGSNQAAQRHLGLPGTCPSRGQIPKPTKRKTARNASKQTVPTHLRTVSPKEVARAALAPNSQALPGRRARCRRAPREGQPAVGVELPNGPLRRADEASSPSSSARGSSAQLPGSPWCRARCRRAPREGQPVVGVERPNGSLRPTSGQPPQKKSRARL